MKDSIIRVLLIVIPQSADQPIIAEQVVNIGAGIKLQMESFKHFQHQLLDTVDQVLNHPSYKKAVANIRESFQKSGGYHKAVEEIFKFKNSIGMKDKDL